MASQVELTPCGAMFDIFKRAAHLSHIELCGLVLSSRPLADGRSPQSRAADRSWVSRFIVRAPVGTLQQRYFAEYGTSAARIMSQLALRQRNPMDSTAVINMVCGPAGEPMVRALEECHQDTNLYRNALDRLSQAAELMPAERAEAVLVLFVAVGCSADVRSSVNYAIDYAHATCGGGTSTPRSLGISMTAGEREPAPAHPLGLLRVQNSFVVSAPRWIQPSEQGVEIGALATGEGDITDVGDDVSARHAHIWCDAQNIWHVEDLSSTNGTVVVNGATRVCIQVEPGRSAQLNPGDELKLGPHADFRCGRFPSPGRAREHPACGLCGARSCARRAVGSVGRTSCPSPRHVFSPRHVPAAEPACQMIGSNSVNPITPTSRRSPGPVYLYERRGVYGA